MPKRRSSRSAVSGVTPRLPCTSSLTRGYETPSRSAKPVWLKPSGLRNSSSSISPGCVGAPSVGTRTIALLPSSARSMVIRDLDPTRSLCRPAKTDPVLIVDPDAMLPRAVLAECFQVIARGYPKRPERNGGVQLVELAFCGASQLLGARSARRLGAAPVEDVLRSLTIERANHGRRPASLNEYYNGYRYMCQPDWPIPPASASSQRLPMSSWCQWWCQTFRRPPLQAVALGTAHRCNTTASAGMRWPCGITNRELYH